MTKFGMMNTTINEEPIICVDLRITSGMWIMRQIDGRNTSSKCHQVVMAREDLFGGDRIYFRCSENLIKTCYSCSFCEALGGES